MFTEFEHAAGGGGGNWEGGVPKKYLLKHYSSMDLALYVRDYLSETSTDWEELHKLLYEEQCDVFNPCNHLLADECAHTLFFRVDEDLNYQPCGVYSYGVLIPKHVAFQIADEQLPDVAEYDLATVFRKEKYIMHADGQLADLYPDLVLGVVNRQRNIVNPIVWPPEKRPYRTAFKHG